MFQWERLTHLFCNVLCVLNFAADVLLLDKFTAEAKMYSGKRQMNSFISSYDSS